MNVFICVYICMCVCMYVSRYVCMYMYVYMYVWCTMFAHTCQCMLLVVGYCIVFNVCYMLSI